MFYTGIPTITQNEDGTGVIMGHKVAYVLAELGVQWMPARLAQRGWDCF